MADILTGTDPKFTSIEQDLKLQIEDTETSFRPKNDTDSEPDMTMAGTQKKAKLKNSLF